MTGIAQRMKDGAQWRMVVLRRWVGSHLAPIEHGSGHKNIAPIWPPIFVVGAPRTGTTLVYQVLTAGLQLSYFLNLADAYPLIPCVVTRVVHTLATVAPPNKFRSRYGETRGWMAPSHGRHIWARWFPGDQSYVGPKVLSRTSIDEIKGTIACVEDAFRMPFINKAQGNCVRVHPLCEAFPKAVFVRVHRSHLQTVESILRSRKSLWGTNEHWFSARPSNFGDLGSLSPCRQVCEQVHGIEADLSRDLTAAAPNRVFDVHYETFCHDPRSVLMAFRGFYQQHADHLVPWRTQVPRAFEVSHKRSSSTTELAELRAHVERLWPADSGPRKRSNG